MASFQFTGGWNFALELPAFKVFKLNNEADQVSGRLQVTVVDALNHDPDPLPEQVKALEFLIESQYEIVEAIFQAAQKKRLWWAEIWEEDPDDEDFIEMFPRIDKLEDLFQVISLREISIELYHKKAMAMVQLVADWSWDEEHGLEIWLWGTEVLSMEPIGEREDFEADETSEELVEDREYFDGKDTLEKPLKKYGRLKPWQIHSNGKLTRALFMDTAKLHELKALFENDDLPIEGVILPKLWHEPKLNYVEFAVQNGLEDLAYYLLGKGSKPGFSLKYCLEQATFNLELYERIIAANPDLNLADRHGNALAYLGRCLRGQLDINGQMGTSTAAQFLRAEFEKWVVNKIPFDSRQIRGFQYKENHAPKEKAWLAILEDVLKKRDDAPYLEEYKIYRDGTRELIEVQQYKNGLLHGNWEGYRQNGKLRTAILYENEQKLKEEIWEEDYSLECHFIKGKLALRKTQYQDGRKVKEEFKEGIRTFRSEWNSDGQQVVETIYHEGSKGTQKKWDDAGYLLAEGEVEWDTPQGKWVFYSKKGEKKADVTYNKRPELHEAIYYHPNGNIAKKTLFRNKKDHGPFESYFPNGNMHIKSSMVDEKWDGEYWEYHETGELKFHGEFQNGKKVGIWKSFNSTGEQFDSKDFGGEPKHDFALNNEHSGASPLGGQNMKLLIIMLILAVISLLVYLAQ